MAALTKERNTQRTHVDYELSLKMKGATKIQNGALVAILAGYALPADDAANHVVMGVAYETVDNTAGADGDLSISVRVGGFWYDNGTGADIAQADVGKLATVLTDHSVSLAAVTVNDITAGKILAVDASLGVLIDVRQKTA